jgi:hypothetical protein
MIAVDIKDSLIRPFSKLLPTESNVRPYSGYTKQQYVSNNLPCGNINFGNMGSILGSADRNLLNSRVGVQAVMGIVDTGIQTGLLIAQAGAECLDFLGKLTDKVASLNISHLLDKIDMAFDDLKIGLSKVDGDFIKDCIKGIGNSLVKIAKAAGNALSGFAPGARSNTNIPTIKDPISNVAKMMECKEDTVLGLLSMGLTKLAQTSGTSFDFKSPVSGVMGAINGTMSVVNGAVSYAAKGVAGIQSTVNGITDKIPPQMKSALAGISPEVGRFMTKNGVSSILGTALGNSLQGSFGNKSVSACIAAQSLNRFGNYDPFISTAMGVSGLSAANQQMAYQQYGLNQGSFSDRTACYCCSGDMYRARDAKVDTSTKYYDRSTQYIDSTKQLPGQTFSFPSSTSSLPNGLASQVVSTYGFDESNILTQNLGTNLETYRVSNSLLGNLSEVQTDFSKINDFSGECRSSVDYVNRLNENNVQNNVVLFESMHDIDREMDASALTGGWPLNGTAPDSFPLQETEPLKGITGVEDEWASLFSPEEIS